MSMCDISQVHAVELGVARRAEIKTTQLAQDIKTLTQWLRRDVLPLAKPCLATRIERFDFVTALLLAASPCTPNASDPCALAATPAR